MYSKTEDNQRVNHAICLRLAPAFHAAWENSTSVTEIQHEWCFGIGTCSSLTYSESLYLAIMNSIDCLIGCPLSVHLDKSILPVERDTQNFPIPSKDFDEVISSDSLTIYVPHKKHCSL